MKTLRLIALLCSVAYCAALDAQEPAETPPPAVASRPAPRTEQAFLLHFTALDEERGLERGSGTAFPIAAHQLLTAEHCVHANVELSIRFGDEWHDCKVLKCDDEMDVAVIECTDATFTPIELTTEELTEGKIVGYPDGLMQTIAFVNVDMHVRQTWIHTVFATKAFTHGSSGSPLLGLDNKCCGMAVVMLEGRNGNFAGYIPSRRIKQFLAEPEEKPAAKPVEKAPAVPAPKVEPKKSSVQFR